MRFKIKVTDPAHTKGLGPVIVEAINETAAKAQFLHDEGTTEEALAADGMTVWTIEELEA